MVYLPGLEERRPNPVTAKPILPATPLFRREGATCKYKALGGDRASSGRGEIALKQFRPLSTTLKVKLPGPAKCNWTYERNQTLYFDVKYATLAMLSLMLPG